MKKCPNCNEVKLLEDFALNKGKLDGRQGECRSCKQKRDKQYYANNATEHKKRTLSYLNRVKSKAYEFLSTHPCIDCGENDPVVLEFDHVRGQKVLSVASAIQYGWSWDRVLTEIAKCEVRCANCHRRKTAKDFNWYSYLDMGVEQDGTASGS